MLTILNQKLVVNLSQFEINIFHDKDFFLQKILKKELTVYICSDSINTFYKRVTLLKIL